MELIDLLDRILDKGIVVDASSRLHLIGVRARTHRLNFVIASMETHLKHSEPHVMTKLAGRRPLASEDHPKVTSLPRGFAKSHGA
jgi:hypothetical protein